MSTHEGTDGDVAPHTPKRSDSRVSYPHRVSLDLDETQYRWLRAEARDARVTASVLVRAALDHLREDAVARTLVRQRAEDATPK